MDYELIFWSIIGVVSFVLLIGAWLAPSDYIDITWGKERDWARQERKWM
jgi:hypothetical protein